MSLQRGDGYWLWVGGPVPRGAAAITVGRLVSVRRRSADDAHLLAHERQHVRQYAERGVAAFLVAYLADYLRQRLRGWPHWAAYRRLGLEVEAEWRVRRPDLAPGAGSAHPDPG
ncbi:MAG TPA: DUF4157 domain-containing protein [Acidimicrobiales bacterium]|nr:DUF4157 domain-containing protein [Acidimicrobiales bacterium]